MELEVGSIVGGGGDIYDVRLDYNVSVGKWPHCNVEYRQAAPFVLSGLNATLGLKRAVACHLIAP